MGRQETQPDDLREKATAKGYKQGAQRTEDSKRESTTYVPKTLKDQKGAWKRYEKWVALVEKPKHKAVEVLSNKQQIPDSIYYRGLLLDWGEDRRLFS